MSFQVRCSVCDRVEPCQVNRHAEPLLPTNISTGQSWGASWGRLPGGREELVHFCSPACHAFYRKVCMIERDLAVAGEVSP